MFLVISEQLPQNNNTRNFTNKPEVRFMNILNLLEEKKYEIIINNKIITTKQLKDLNVHDSQMIDFLENCISSYKQSENQDDTFGNLENGLIPYNVSKNFPRFDISILEYYKQIGIWLTDHITPIFENTFKEVLSSASNGWIVPKYLEMGYKRIYCLNINPGHHAGRRFFGGYCYLNNAAICARSILDNCKHVKKIATLDLDYHAGDGMETIFPNCNYILNLSIHINPAYDYPFYSGVVDSYPSFNLTFNPGCTLETYLSLVEKAIEDIKKFQPDVLIIPFGGDTYKDDLDALSQNRTCLDINDYYIIGKTISNNFPDIPIVVTQEGGYNMEKIADIIESFLSGLKI